MINHKIIRVTIYILLWVGTWATIYCGQNQKSENESTNQNIFIDDFDKSPNDSYAWLHRPRYVSHGYGIYYANAGVKLSRVAVSDADSALRIEYEIPPLYDWGNWLSIRCEFDSVLNLQDFHGLKLDIKVEEPSNGNLRVTLSDVVNINKRGVDELWWFDFKSEVLAGPIDQWQTLTLPFKNFYESYGAGTRHNDSKLDLSKIVAYEINIVSEGRTHIKGTIVVNSLVTY